MKIGKKAIIASILGVSLAGVGAYQTNIGKADPADTNFVEVRRGSIREELTLSGEINAREKVSLRFQTSGKLTHVAVSEGDFVTKGQYLASLDKKELEKNLTKKLNDFSSERWDFDQQKEDYEDEIITVAMQRILDKAQFHLNNAVIDVEIKNLALEYSNLFTPISGVVTRIDTPYAGINTTPATAEFEIINPKSYRFELEADQNDVIKLIEGMPGQLTLDSAIEETVSTIIETISYTPKSGKTGVVYKVICTIPQLPKGITFRIGMTGDATFVTKSVDKALFLPPSFVKENDDGAYVTIKKGDVQEYISITTGVETDERIEVISGLNEGVVVYD